MIRTIPKNIAIMVFFLVLMPSVFGSVGIELGVALHNTDIIRGSDFSPYSGRYTACVTDQVTLPLRLTNTNSFSELYTLRVDDSRVALSSTRAALQSKQSGIITLTLPPDSFSAANTSLIVHIASRREAVERSFAIDLSYDDCFRFAVDVSSEQSSYCGCEAAGFDVVIANEGEQSDSYLVSFEGPPWMVNELGADTVDLARGATTTIAFGGSVPCLEENALSFTLDVTSGGSGLLRQVARSYELIPFGQCYDTRVAVSDVLVDYSGKAVPVKISNKGLRAAQYSLSLTGINWYVPSSESFALAPGQSKIVTLYLKPGSEVEEGKYDVTLLLQGDVFDAERDLHITVKRESNVASLIQFYAEFFRYYWFVVIAVFLVVFLVSRYRGRLPTAEKRAIRSTKTSDKKEFSLHRFWTWIYAILAGVVVFGFLGAVASYYLHRAGMETVLPQPASWLINVLFGGMLFIVVVPLLGYWVLKGKRSIITIKRAPSKKEEQREVSHTSTQKVPQMDFQRIKNNAGDWMVVSLVFLVLGAGIALFEVLRAKTFPILNEFLLVYYPYIVAGFAVLFVLVGILVTIDSRKKNK